MNMRECLQALIRNCEESFDGDCPVVAVELRPDAFYKLAGMREDFSEQKNHVLAMMLGNKVIVVKKAKEEEHEC